MSKHPFSKIILEKVNLITGKRSRVVVEHILKHGSVTTEDLERVGYSHAPRAIRDVREQGLPLVRTWVKSSTGRKIASYTFGQTENIRHDRLGGRKVIAKAFHEAICISGGGKCAICLAAYENRYLQVDHRIPFEVIGDSAGADVSDYMPICGSCNRAKSWSCEHCANWQMKKDPEVCATCYWAKPDDYTHVAMSDVRRLDVIWQGEEVADYSVLADMADESKQPIPDFVKKALRRLASAEGARPKSDPK